MWYQTVAGSARHDSRDPVFVSWHVTLDEKLSALPDMQKESESPSLMRLRDAPIMADSRFFTSKWLPVAFSLKVP